MNSKRSLILAGVLSLGLVPYVLAPAPAAAAEIRRGDDAHIIQRKIRFNDLPRPAQAAVNDEAGRPTDQIKEVWHVTRGGRSVYRVVIGARDRVFALIVDAQGRIWGTQEAADDVRQQVPWDRLPRPVQEVFDRERGGGGNRGNITRITFEERGRRTVYAAYISHPDGLRVVTVDERGRVLGEDDVDWVAPGLGRSSFDDDRFNADLEESDWDNVRYRDLPNRVQSAFDDIRGRSEVEHLHKLTDRTRGTRYVGVVTSRHGERLVVVDEQGRILQDRLLVDEEDARPNRDIELSKHRSRARELALSERASLKYDDLPRAVAKTLDRERDHKEMAHIHKLSSKSAGVRYSVLIIDRKNGHRRLIVDDDGRILDDKRLPRRDD